MLKTPLLIAGIFFCLLNATIANTIDSLKEKLSVINFEDSVKVRLYLDLSHLYFDISPDSTLQYALVAHNAAKHIHNNRLYTAANLQIASAFYQLSKYDSAMLYASYTLSLSQKHKEQGYYTRALNSIGNIYLRQNDYSNALRYYDSCKTACIQYNDSTEMATAVNNIAIIKFEQGNYAEALKSHLQTLEINERLGRKNEIETTLLNIANLFFRLGEYDKAKQYTARALKMAEESGSKWSVVSVHTTYAMIYNEEQKHDSSLQRLNEAMGLAKSINSPYLINIINGNLAECYLNMGNIAKSETLYNESLIESRKLNDQMGIALAKGGLGQIMVRKGNTQQGISFLEDALIVLQENEMPEQAMHLADTLANALEKTGHYKKALKYTHIKDGYRKTIAKNKGRIAAQKMEYDYALEQKEAQIALLEKEKTIENSKVRTNRIILFSALTGMLLAIIIALLLFRNMMNVKRRNEVIVQQKKEIEQQAEKLQRLNAFKDTTFSVLSHDLRSPINALTGTMAMLDEGIITPEEFTEHKNELNNKLQSVTLMLDNLLQWAKSQMKGEQTLDPEKIKVRRKVLKNFAVLKDAAEQKNITLAANIDEHLYVYADHNQIEMVMRNLISNAIKFTPPAGSISVSAQLQGNNVAIAIADSGVGMTREQANQLFDGSPNDSTHGTSGEKGTGIGLHLSHSFIINNSGSISVDSEPGKGTTFTLLLPSAV